MRKGFAIALLFAILFGAGYFYYIAQAVCPAPLSYRIGTIDDRFDLSRDDARLALSEAESAWEDATGRNLFSYEQDGDVVVNFVYDERQQFVNEEGTFKEKLDAAENVSDAIRDTYAKLVAQYSDLKVSYEGKVAAYERRLNAYNAEVEKYNKQGGAPGEVYAELTKERDSLSAEQREINALSSQLNALVAQINSVGEKGNSLIKSYNTGVSLFNQKFGDSREFTQGDYTNKTITVYTFEDLAELKHVLIHELGHALSLDHVEGTSSAMYYLIGGQDDNDPITSADLKEFNRVCGNLTLWERAKLAISPR